MFGGPDNVLIFQSTSLTRGTTEKNSLKLARIKISIHVPHTRDDFKVGKVNSLQRNFNPRPSHEGRLQNKQVQRNNLYESLVIIHIKKKANRRFIKLLTTN